MFFLRRIIKQIVLVTVIGFVIRKLMASSDPRAQKVGHQINRVVGGVFGLDERGHRVPRRHRTAMTKSAGSALVGGALSYFFDPKQGYDRRAKAKTFASEKLARRNGSTTYGTLPAATHDASTPRTTGSPQPAL
jgi:hypothetical protein